MFSSVKVMAAKNLFLISYIFNGPGLNPQKEKAPAGGGLRGRGGQAARAARRCLTYSMTPGRMEMKMMARMTAVKLLLTTGILPKK